MAETQDARQTQPTIVLRNSATEVDENSLSDTLYVHRIVSARHIKGAKVSNCTSGIKGPHGSCRIRNCKHDSYMCSIGKDDGCQPDIYFVCGPKSRRHCSSIHIEDAHSMGLNPTC